MLKVTKGDNMKALAKIETTLDNWFSRLPVLPESTRKGLADIFWWLALLFGVLQLWMAWRLWDVAHYAEYVGRADFVNRYYDNDLGFFYYAAFFVLLFSAALYLFAAPGLKAFKKVSGWNLAFYAFLTHVLYGLLIGLTDVYGGFGDFLWTLIVAAVVGYFIFQVRGQFNGGKLSGHVPTRRASRHKNNKKGSS